VPPVGAFSNAELLLRESIGDGISRMPPVADIADIVEPEFLAGLAAVGLATSLSVLMIVTGIIIGLESVGAEGFDEPVVGVAPEDGRDEHGDARADELARLVPAHHGQLLGRACCRLVSCG
jgi:hypothetical protein